MTVETRLIYSSPNGDDWFLAYDTVSDRAYVQHRANAASGGHVTESPIGEFLGRGPHNPEHLALLRLIGTLVREPEPAGTARARARGSTGKKQH
jgi:hypothetical protein